MEHVHDRPTDSCALPHEAASLASSASPGDSAPFLRARRTGRRWGIAAALALALLLAVPWLGAAGKAPVGAPQHRERLLAQLRNCC